MELFLEIVTNVVFLVSVFVIVGLVKEFNLFFPFYAWLTSKVKSRRALPAIICAVTGVLPIEGRLTTSASLLDTIAPKDPNKRSKFGILNYISTHHYYVWSPLERTIIVLMSVFSMSYLQVLTYTFPLVLISFAYIIWFILKHVEDASLNISEQEREVSKNSQNVSSILITLPLLAAIIALIFQLNAGVVFGLTALFYYKYCLVKYRPSSLSERMFDPENNNCYVRYGLVILLVLLMLLGAGVKCFSEDINTFLAGTHLTMTTVSGFIGISVLSFIGSFILGSSSKFIGIVAMLTSLYGLPYLVWFFTIEYAGYLLSPFHKCFLISCEFFKTDKLEYFKYVGVWVAIMVLYALGVTLLWFIK